jgi:hypothetical protein
MAFYRVNFTFTIIVIKWAIMVVISGLFWDFTQRRPEMSVRNYHFTQRRPEMSVRNYHFTQRRPKMSVRKYHFTQRRPEMLVRNYHSTLRKIPKQSRSHLRVHRGRSLKSPSCRGVLEHFVRRERAQALGGYLLY